MKQVDSKFMSARHGVYHVNDTTAVTTKKFDGFEVSKGTVVSELKDQDGTDVLADYISTAATAFDKTTLITATSDNYFTYIKLGTAGSASLVLTEVAG